MSGLVQLLEVIVCMMFGDFHTPDINFGRGGDNKFLVCSMQMNQLKDRGPGSSSKPLLS